MTVIYCPTITNKTRDDALRDVIAQKIYCTFIGDGVPCTGEWEAEVSWLYMMHWDAVVHEICILRSYILIWGEHNLTMNCFVPSKKKRTNAILHSRHGIGRPSNNNMSETLWVNIDHKAITFCS